MTTAQDVKDAMLSVLEPMLRSAGWSAEAVNDEIDLRKAGLIDSLGFMQLLAELEIRLGGPIELATMDVERLTHVGALTRHIADQRSAR